VHKAVGLVTGFLKDDVKAEAVVGALRAREFKAVEVQVPYVKSRYRRICTVYMSVHHCISMVYSIYILVS
jgi:hypothetical protein